MLYHLAVYGQIITNEPLTLEMIFQIYGNTNILERSGIKLIAISTLERSK